MKEFMKKNYEPENSILILENPHKPTSNILEI